MASRARQMLQLVGADLSQTTRHKKADKMFSSDNNLKDLSYDDLEACRQEARLVLADEELGVAPLESLQVNESPQSTLNCIQDSCRKRLFAAEDEPYTPPNKSSRLEEFMISDVSPAKQALTTQLQELKRDRARDLKEGHFSSARRKSKKIRKCKDLIEKIDKGLPVETHNLPLPNPKTDIAVKSTIEADANEDQNPPDSTMKRRGKKENYCMYCNKLVKEYCVHIERHHHETEEGQKLLAVKESDGRLRGIIKKRITEKLRKKSNAIYNEMILGELRTDSGDEKYKKQVILVKRRHHVIQTEKNTSICMYCEGYYKKDRMSVHLKQCKEYKSRSQSDCKTKIKDHSQPMSMIGTIKGASQELKEEVLAYMNEDEVKELAIKDELIMKFGSEFHLSRREKMHGYYTASKIRDLTNLVIKMKELDPSINFLEDCLSPAKFDTLVEAALNISGYDPKSGSLKIPSIAYRLSQPLKIAATIGETQAMCDSYREGSNDQTKVKLFKDFLKLMEKLWANKIGRISSKIRKISQVEKSNIFALEEDIIALCAYIMGRYRPLLKKLRKSTPKHKIYDDLMMLLICHIMCLIRRRPVDFKRATLLHYSLIDRQDDLLDMVKKSHISNEENGKSAADSHIETAEIEKCKNFHIFYVPGKNLEIVPIVLTPLMKEVLDALTHQRLRVGISDTSPENNKLFLFSHDKPADPGICLKKVKAKINLKSPLTLTNNGLRHHAATFSKLHSSHPQYQDFLASALGHSLVVHKKHYELPTSVLQKLIVCPILHKMTVGNHDSNLRKCGNVGECSETSQELGQPEVTKNAGNLLIENTCVTKEHPEVLEKSQLMEKAEIYVNNTDGLRDGMLPESYSTDDECIEKTKSTKIQSPSLKKRATSSKLRWTATEKESIFKTFGEEILNKRLPSRSAVFSFVEENRHTLGNRSAHSVYTYIHNNVNRKQKNVSPSVKKILRQHI